MAPETISKSMRRKLNKSNVRVEDPSGFSYRVPPVKELRDPIERFLPPAGQYYDQSIFDTTEEIHHHKRCVLCWNPKAAGKECKCTTKCTTCGTKQHRNIECPRIYASIKWWQNHGHRLRKKARLWPNPGERAYLVVAGVFKDWKKLEDPVIVNMGHPVVKAFYEGKAAPHTLSDLPEKLRSRPAGETATRTKTPDVYEEASGTGRFIVVDNDSKLEPVPHGKLDSIYEQKANLDLPDELHDIKDVAQISTKGAGEDKSFLNDLLEDTWQVPSYHKGNQMASIMPLSIRPALHTAQEFAPSHQPAVSKSNEVNPDLDPRLRARAPSQSAACSPRLPTTHDTSCSQFVGVIKDASKEHKCEHCREELQNAREEIRAKDRRIRELELALHEAEGWTDAMTYHGGQKRSRA